MTGNPVPVFRTSEIIQLAGLMALYSSQAEAATGIPEQWRRFLGGWPSMTGDSDSVYGASPCTDDRKIHYLSGVTASGKFDSGTLEQLTLLAGKYAVFTVPLQDRGDVWKWILGEWLPGSGIEERNAPEFEKFHLTPNRSDITGPVELWIPIQA